MDGKCSLLINICTWAPSYSQFCIHTIELTFGAHAFAHNFQEASTKKPNSQNHTQSTHKRTFRDGEGERFSVGNQESKRRITSSNIAHNALHGFSAQEVVLTLEPLIQRCVRDEVQRACQRIFCTLPRSPINALEPCKTASLQLRFQTKLPNTFFTGSRIESEDNTPVKLVLFDINSNKIVSSGPFTSLKVNIVPLDGDFSADDEQDWPESDFDAKVICERDGR